MHLHTGTYEKFIPTFAQFVGDEFANQTHHYVMFTVPGGPQPSADSVVQFAPSGLLPRLRFVLQLAKQFQRADKIYVHSLFSFEVVLLLFLMPWVLPKAHWFLWGGDLYLKEEAPQGGLQRLKWQLKELVRGPVIKRMGTLVTYIDGDVDLARHWYGARGQQHVCFMYLSNVFKPVVLEHDVFKPDVFKPNVSEPEERQKRTFEVQVGNSGTPSNRHDLAFSVLAPFAHENLTVNVPLAYGEKAYIAQVVQQGKRLFSDKFQAQLEFLAYTDYLKSLASMDAALFTHNRQQAMGNTIQLLGLGKKVYLSKEVTPWPLFQKLGIKVFDYKNFNLQRLSKEEREQNIKLVEETFSVANFRRQLAGLFK